MPAKRAAAAASPAAAACRRLRQRKRNCRADCCSSERPAELQATSRAQTAGQWLPGSATAAAAHAELQKPTLPQLPQGTTAAALSSAKDGVEGQQGRRRP
jgi:hypothetical protein